MAETAIGILTVSDSCSRGLNTDKSGPNLKEVIQSSDLWKNAKIENSIVSDNFEEIKTKLIQWVDEKGFQLILTTGGTGFSPSDVTPEVTRAIIEKEAPGISQAMLIGSLNVTHLAMLSRPVCGIRKRSLIVNLPGSTKGSQECFEFIRKALPHALDLLCDRTQQIIHTHAQQQNTDNKTESKTIHEPEKTHPIKQQISCDHENVHPGEHHDTAACDPFQRHPIKSGVDKSRVAHRPRESPYPIISVEQAIEIVLKEASIKNTSSFNYKDALGYVLAEDVFSPEALPPFAASIKDGYAVKASDGRSSRRVLGDSIAGSQPQSEVIPGYCLRISTGAQIPVGADAVVQVENTDLVKDADGGKVELEVFINKAPTVGQDIRRVGSDIAIGQKLLQSGICLGPAEIGLLATVGVTSVTCYSKPVVGVMSTGTELVEPDQPLKRGQIRDANRTTLTCAIKEAGFETIDLGIAADTTQSLLDQLTDGLDKCDIMVTSGGVSMGEKDLLKDVLQLDFRAKLHFARVFMKPGKPTTFATLTHNGRQKLLFCLPGNPVSATVTCHLYVLPALRQMSGHVHPCYPVLKAKIANDVKLDPRPEYHRCIVTWRQNDPIPKAESTGNQLSSRLLSMRAANALMMLPPLSSEVNQIIAGSLIDCMLLKY